MSKKNNLKSVRLSDEVMKYVLDFEGDGFNQKFENLVFFCMREEKVKRESIRFLDSKIYQKRKQLRCLDELSGKVSVTLAALTALDWRLDELSETLEGVSQNPSAASSSGTAGTAV